MDAGSNSNSLLIYSPGGPSPQECCMLLEVRDVMALFLHWESGRHASPNSHSVSIPRSETGGSDNWMSTEQRRG